LRLPDSEANGLAPKDKNASASDLSQSGDLEEFLHEPFDPTRYVFPTVIFRGPAGERTVAGWKVYERYEEALAAVGTSAPRDPHPAPTPAEAFAAWPALAPAELEVLCGAGAAPPPDVVAYERGGGLYWLAPDEAAAHGLAPR